MNNLRTLLWIYLWLLIFEGTLRKWIVPALDTPLLIVRDPLVMWIYLVAMRQGLSFKNAFFLPNLFLAIITAVLATMFGQANWMVTLYGLRTDYLQIPLIFLIPQILNRDDIVEMGRFILYMSLPIAVLVIIQFRSPVDSLVNKGAFHTHYGTVRPSGPFSFIPGLVAYYAVVASFLFYGYLQARTYKIWLIAAVTFMLLLSAGCSGSRSCLVSIAIVTGVAILCVVTRGKGGAGLIVAAVVIGLLVPVLSSLTIFQEGSSQLLRRFQDAATVEDQTGGFVGRYANTMLVPLSAIDSVPLFGNGLGLGTNGGSGLLRGDREFIGPEDEWGRLIFECGPVFGLLLILFRTALAATLAKRAYDAFRHGNLLPMLIFAGCGLLILNGQWGVPTTLGFAVFGGGLTLAACEEPAGEDEDEHDHDEEHGHAGDESDHSTATDTVG
jgi:hypothetical protein